jgi:hypothetical protein
VPDLTVIDPPPATAMARPVEDFIDDHWGMGHSIRTTRDAYADENGAPNHFSTARRGMEEELSSVARGGVSSGAL